MSSLSYYNFLTIVILQAKQCIGRTSEGLSAFCVPSLTEVTLSQIDPFVTAMVCCGVEIFFFLKDSMSSVDPRKEKLENRKWTVV